MHFSNYPSTPSEKPREAGILHLGLGNFHRAHQAVYTANALERDGGDWGIVGVASRSHRIVDSMRAQGGAYSVITLSPTGPSADVFEVHTDLLVASEQLDELNGYFASERIRIVTLTVSENGYTYSHARKGLDVDSDVVKADLAGGAPMTAIGQLASGLSERYRRGGAPLTIVSCDNMNDNGAVTRSLVLQFLAESKHLNGAGFSAWVESHVTFPSTMVDRIVPATENRHRDLSASLTGVRDNAPVPAEPFTMWVLEDDFAAGRPDWAGSGAIFTSDVRSFELVKLRLLNSSNSLLSYLGLLSGNKFIAEGFANPRFRVVVEQLMRDEMLETITVPDLIDVETYIDQLFERFSNIDMEDRTIRVASDGSTKLPVRITEPVLYHHSRGGSSPVLALLLASYLRTFCDSDSYAAESTGRPDDPCAGLLADLGARTHSSADLVTSVIVESGIFSPALAEATEWLDLVAEMLEILRTHGVDFAIDRALAQK